MKKRIKFSELTEGDIFINSNPQYFGFRSLEKPADINFFLNRAKLSANAILFVVSKPKLRDDAENILANSKTMIAQVFYNKQLYWIMDHDPDYPDVITLL